MKIRRSLLKDAVTVETYQGDGAYGPVYAPARGPVACNIDETRRLVRDANGDQVVSEVTMHLHPQTRLPGGGTIDPYDAFVAESRAVVRGRTVNVISVKAPTVRGRTAFVEVTCT